MEEDYTQIIRDLTKEIISLAKQLGEMEEKYSHLQMFQKEQELLRQGRENAEQLKKNIDAKS